MVEEATDAIREIAEISITVPISACLTELDLFVNDGIKTWLPLIVSYHLKTPLFNHLTSRLV